VSALACSPEEKKPYLPTGQREPGWVGAGVGSVFYFCYNGKCLPTTLQIVLNGMQRTRLGSQKRSELLGGLFYLWRDGRRGPLAQTREGPFRVYLLEKKKPRRTKSCLCPNNPQYCDSYILKAAARTTGFEPSLLSVRFQKISGKHCAADISGEEG